MVRDFIFLVLFFVLLIAWLVIWAALHMAGGAIHLLLALAVIFLGHSPVPASWFARGVTVKSSRHSHRKQEAAS